MEPARLARPHLEGNEQAIAGALDGRGLDGRRDRARAVVREAPALDLRLQQPGDLRERHVDREPDGDAAAIDLRHDIDLGRERAIRLGLARDHPGLGLHAEHQVHRLGLDAGMRRKGPHRAHLEPQVGHAGGRLLERDRPAHTWPTRAAPPVRWRGRCGSASPARRLLGDRPIDQRLYLLGDVEHAAGDRQRDIRTVTWEVEVRLQPPARRQARPRQHGDISAQLRLLVERLAGENSAPHCPTSLPAKPAMRPFCRPGPDLVADLPGQPQRPVERGRRPHGVGTPADAERTPRHGPADLGLRQQLGDRVFAACRPGRAGATASRASRMAMSETAIGAIRNELVVIGASGRVATTAGASRRSGGHSVSMTRNAIVKNATNDGNANDDVTHSRPWLRQPRFAPHSNA